MSTQVQPLPARTAEVIGRVIGEQFEVVRCLGEGGLGAVYSALHLPTGRRAVVKVLRGEHVPSTALAETILDEAKTAALLRHENIVDILSGGIGDGGDLLIVMEYLDGADLGYILRHEGPLPWGRARGILLQLGSALHAVHRHGLLHGDLEPGNVFLLNRPHRRDLVKLLDFGVARVTAARFREPDPDTAADLPATGTPQYLAPERLKGEGDARSDVYALGCLAYHMVTGSPPFAAETFEQLRARHRYEPPEPPRLRRPDLDIPPGVEVAILRAMDKDPERRHASAAELADAFERCRYSAELPAVTAPPGRTKTIQR
jgi:serine/threonine-protein kinase